MCDLLANQENSQMGSFNNYLDKKRGWCSAHGVTGKSKVYNTSGLEAHAGFFRLLMKGIFDHYVL